EGFSICYWRQMTKNKATTTVDSGRVTGLHGGSTEKARALNSQQLSLL
ncbi:hypothetical protein L195_g060854, partial [Trifolium pratense]